LFPWNVSLGDKQMNETVPVRIQTGAPVRIDGKEFSAGPVISGGRVLFDKEAGTQLVISEIAQMRMALDLRLRDNAPFEKLSSARRHALRIDWGTFTPRSAISQ
jgi:putative transposase